MAGSHPATSHGTETIFSTISELLSASHAREIELFFEPDAGVPADRSGVCPEGELLTSSADYALEGVVPEQALGCFDHVDEVMLGRADTT